MIITVITIIILKRFGGWDTKFELPFGTITGWPDSQPAEKGLGVPGGDRVRPLYLTRVHFLCKESSL